MLRILAFFFVQGNFRLVSEQQIFFSNIPIHYWILMCKRGWIIESILAEKMPQYLASIWWFRTLRQLFSKQNKGLLFGYISKLKKHEDVCDETSLYDDAAGFFESPGENKRKIFAQISVLVLKENFNVIWLRHALKYSTSKLNQIVGWSFCWKTMHCFEKWTCINYNLQNTKLKRIRMYF